MSEQVDIVLLTPSKQQRIWTVPITDLMRGHWAPVATKGVSPAVNRARIMWLNLVYLIGNHLLDPSRPKDGMDYRHHDGSIRWGQLKVNAEHMAIQTIRMWAGQSDKYPWFNNMQYDFSGYLRLINPSLDLSEPAFWHARRDTLRKATEMRWWVAPDQIQWMFHVYTPAHRYISDEHPVDLQLDTVWILDFDTDEDPHFWKINSRLNEGMAQLMSDSGVNSKNAEQVFQGYIQRHSEREDDFQSEHGRDIVSLDGTGVFSDITGADQWTLEGEVVDGRSDIDNILRRWPDMYRSWTGGGDDSLGDAMRLRKNRDIVRAVLLYLQGEGDIGVNTFMATLNPIEYHNEHDFGASARDALMAINQQLNLSHFSKMATPQDPVVSSTNPNIRALQEKKVTNETKALQGLIDMHRQGGPSTISDWYWYHMVLTYFNYRMTSEWDTSEDFQKTVRKLYDELRIDARNGTGTAYLPAQGKTPQQTSAILRRVHVGMPTDSQIFVELMDHIMGKPTQRLGIGQNTLPFVNVRGTKEGMYDWVEQYRNVLLTPDYLDLDEQGNMKWKVPDNVLNRITAVFGTLLEKYDFVDDTTDSAPESWMLVYEMAKTYAERLDYMGLNNSTGTSAEFEEAVSAASDYLLKSPRLQTPTTRYWQAFDEYQHHRSEYPDEEDEILPGEVDILGLNPNRERDVVFPDGNVRRSRRVSDVTEVEMEAEEEFPVLEENVQQTFRDYYAQLPYEVQAELVHDLKDEGLEFVFRHGYHPLLDVIQTYGGVVPDSTQWLQGWRVDRWMTERLQPDSGRAQVVNPTFTVDLTRPSESRQEDTRIVAPRTSKPTTQTGAAKRVDNTTDARRKQKEKKLEKNRLPIDDPQNAPPLQPVEEATPSILPIGTVITPADVSPIVVAPIPEPSVSDVITEERQGTKDTAITASSAKAKKSRTSLFDGGMKEARQAALSKSRERGTTASPLDVSPLRSPVSQQSVIQVDTESATDEIVELLPNREYEGIASSDKLKVARTGPMVSVADAFARRKALRARTEIMRETVVDSSDSGDPLTQTPPVAPNQTAFVQRWLAGIHDKEWRNISTFRELAEQASAAWLEYIGDWNKRMQKRYGVYHVNQDVVWRKPTWPEDLSMIRMFLARGPTPKGALLRLPDGVNDYRTWLYENTNDLDWAAMPTTTVPELVSDLERRYQAYVTQKTGRPWENFIAIDKYKKPPTRPPTRLEFSVDPVVDIVGAPGETDVATSSGMSLFASTAQPTVPAPTTVPVATTPDPPVAPSVTVVARDDATVVPFMPRPTPPIVPGTNILAGWGQPVRPLVVPGVGPRRPGGLGWPVAPDNTAGRGSSIANDRIDPGRARASLYASMREGMAQAGIVRACNRFRK